MPHTPLETATTNPFQTMQTEYHADLAPRHTLACPATARELIHIDHPDEWRITAPGDRILGGGSNIIFRAEVRERLLCPRYTGRQITGEDPEHLYLRVAAGERWDDLVAWTAAQNWYGIENLAAIPGSVGAAPVQNIGAYGREIADAVHTIHAYNRDTGQSEDIPAAACGFAYRQSHYKQHWRSRYIISAITLRLAKRGQPDTAYPGLREQAAAIHDAQDAYTAIRRLRATRLPDPKTEPNAGSFFHNPITDRATFSALQQRYPDIPHYPTADGRVKIPAAWCIEQSGYKGLRDGKVGISDKHALVLTNHGGTAAEILAFAARIQADVHARYGLSLAIEPDIIGED